VNLCAAKLNPRQTAVLMMLRVAYRAPATYANHLVHVVQQA
jgi:hypothetical protein